MERISKSGGGVAILINNTLSYKRRLDIEDKFSDLELCAVEVKTTNKPIIFLSLYRAPNSDAKQFNSSYRNILTSLKDEKHKHVIFGLDHNLDLTKSTKHQATRDFLEITLDYEMFPVITKPTRITKSTAMLIDNILVSKELFKQYTSGILIDDISDHLLCLFVAKKSKLSCKEPIVITSRKLTPKIIGRIESALKHTTLVDESQDLNLQFNMFHSKLCNIIDKEAPYESFVPRHALYQKEPWIIPNLLKCITKQKTLYRRTLKKHCPNADREKYKNYHNTLTKVKRSCKKRFFYKKCVEFKSNTRKLWHLINHVSGKMNDKTSIIEFIKEGNIEQYQPNVITNSFGKFFAGVGEKYAQNIPKSNMDIGYYLNSIPRNSKSIYWMPVSHTELSRIIDQLPNKKSSGYDNIDNILLKKLKSVLLEPLCIMFNQLLSSGIFPERMKLAEVVPNYRPISLLLILSKILEKIVYSHTYSFLNDTGQIFQSQYGFRTAHSCENAIQELIGKILKGFESKKSTLAVFLDLSKAFDTISHPVLFKKLETYGIRGTCLQWFKLFM